MEVDARRRLRSPPGSLWAGGLEQAGGGRPEGRDAAGFSTSLAYARLFERARQEGVVVLIDGQGMDEQWAGYDYYRLAAEGRPAPTVQVYTAGPARGSSVFLKRRRRRSRRSWTWRANLSCDYPRADILVRPHPFESPAPYRKRLGPLANVVVDGDGPVQPRIFGAAAVIQRSCTTAIEAGMASVPALSPQWVPTPVVKPVAEAVSEPCASYAELRSRLASILDGSYQQAAELRSEIEGVIHDWFHLSDGRAHERVGEVVARSWSRSRVVDERLCKRYLYGLGVEPVPPTVKLGQWARYAIGLSPNWSFGRLRRVPFRQKSVKDFGVGEVTLLAQRIELAWRATGRDLRPVSVRGAAERGDYENGFMGQSVTLACET